jgi:hypothetical protein
MWTPNTRYTFTIHYNEDKTNNVRQTQHWGALTKPLLPQKNSKSLCICVCVCVCVCMYVWVGGYTDSGICFRACSITNAACNAPPYCHLRTVCLLPIFRHYLINCTIFGEKKLLKMKYVFWFALQVLYEGFLILRRIKRDIVMNVKTSSCKVPVILVEC